MKISKNLKPVLLLIACFSFAFSYAATEIQNNEQVNSTPWYKMWWIWLVILFILGFIIVYVTLKEK